MKIFNSRKNKIHRYVFLATLAIASIIISGRAQQPAATAQQSPEDRVALYQALLDLSNPWTVMCVAAHPDDEDGTSLIVMRRKYGAHTVSLFSTFGEGGQNAIGPELYEELGAIRARETMAAAEIQGSEPHFLGLKDFGYSKSADETFQKWGHEEALRRMVLEIRKLQPDVVITNHSVTSNDHGHHQATARLVVEAFDAAADPKRFPEQLKEGVTTWQVQRLFVRVRGNAAPNPDQQLVTIDPNERDPVRDLVYAEEALRALQKHATQGPWPKTFAEFTARFRAFSGQSGATGQMPLIRYRLEREAKGGAPLSARDSHNFLDGLRLPEQVASELASLNIDGRPLVDFAGHRELVLKTLGSLIKSGRLLQTRAVSNDTKPTLADSKLRMISGKLNVALGISAGISGQLIANTHVLIPGIADTFSFVISNQDLLALRPKLFFSGIGEDSRNVSTLMSIPRNLKVENGKTVATISLTAPKDVGATLPHSEHLYDQRYVGLPAVVSAFVDLGELNSIAVSGSTFVDVAPPIDIEKVDPMPLVLTPQTSAKPVDFKVRIANHQSQAFKGTLRAQSQEVTLDVPSQLTKEVAVRISRIPTGQSELSFTVHGSAAESRKIPVTFADARVAANLRVGYIRGFDFSLPNALNSLGVESKELSVDEVKTADLSNYTSIIVDNRVYESQPELIAANQKLLDYAKAGGTLIVFYHKSDEWNPDARRNRPQLAPYKLVLGNERITDENAPVTFIEPEHPLLNNPNKMGQDDFVGWIQERGLYYPREWDPQFHALLQSNDPGEESLKGGLLVADYERGHYIYSSMVWYRQLRAGVPGAYRMLANMISYGHWKN